MSEEVIPQEASNKERVRVSQTIKALSVLALVRTAFSSERSLMAWIRSSVSLYTFGFAIFKSTDYLGLQARGAQSLEGWRRLGLALICTGILALAFAPIAHTRRIRKMKQLGLPVAFLSSVPIWIVAALFSIWIATLLGIAHNW